MLNATQYLGWGAATDTKPRLEFAGTVVVTTDSNSVVFPTLPIGNPEGRCGFIVVTCYHNDTSFRGGGFYITVNSGDGENTGTTLYANTQYIYTGTRAFLFQETPSLAGKSTVFQGRMTTQDRASLRSAVAVYAVYNSPHTLAFPVSGAGAAVSGTSWDYTAWDARVQAVGAPLLLFGAYGFIDAACTATINANGSALTKDFDITLEGGLGRFVGGRGVVTTLPASTSVVTSRAAPAGKHLQHMGLVLPL